MGPDHSCIEDTVAEGFSPSPRHTFSGKAINVKPFYMINIGINVMKFLVALAITAASSTMALAGGLGASPSDPALAVAATPTAVPADWTGFYAGLGYGRSSGDIDFIPSPAQELDSGTATSAFVGYLWQRNSFVYGGELAYTKLSDAFVTGFTSEVDRSIDLKGPPYRDSQGGIVRGAIRNLLLQTYGSNDALAKDSALKEIA